MISFQEESLAYCMALPLPPLSSMHHLRYKTTLENKVWALFTETWSPHVVLSLTFWLNYFSLFSPLNFFTELSSVYYSLYL